MEFIGTALPLFNKHGEKAQDLQLQTWIEEVDFNKHDEKAQGLQLQTGIEEVDIFWIENSQCLGTARHSQHLGTAHHRGIHFIPQSLHQNIFHVGSGVPGFIQTGQNKIP